MKMLRAGYQRPTAPPKPFRGPVGYRLSTTTVNRSLTEWGAGTRTVGRNGKRFGRW